MAETKWDNGKRAKTEVTYRILAEGLALSSKEQNDLCDVIIQVEDASFYGSRFVLGSASPVLKRMFLDDMKESRSKIVSLKGVSKEGFQVVWDFIYDDRYGTKEEDVALAVLMDAHHLQIDSLCEEYAEKLKEMLRVENAFHFLAVAEKLDARALQDAVVGFIARSFHEIISTPDLLSVSFDTLKTVLQRDDVEVSSEKDIYEAVKKWLDHDPQRKEHANELLDLVRLPLLPPRYLQQHIDRDPLILGNPHCCALVMEAYKFHIEELRETVPVEKAKVRGTDWTHTLWCVGRRKKETNMFSIGLRDWSPRVLTSYPCPSFSPAFSAVDRKLFVTGEGAMKTFDLAKRVWENEPPPSEEVTFPALAVGLDSIFVSGGHFCADDSKKSKSVNRFDLGSWRWIESPDMKYERGAASAVFLDSCLHVVGGYPARNKHERLDPRTDTWTELGEWPGGGYCPGIAVHDGQIHLAGGFSGNDPEFSHVHAYDARTNEWRLLPSMNANRGNPGLVSFEGNLYAVGGDKPPSVEVYDGAKWTGVLLVLDGMDACERACIMEFTAG